MSLLADGMLHPAFPQKQFDVFKADVAQSLGAIANLPSTKAAIAQTDGLYPPGDPRRRRATPTHRFLDGRWSFQLDVFDRLLIGSET